MPTRQGWTALVAAAAAIIIGRTFGIVELYVVAAGLGAALAAALAVVHLGSRPQLRTTRDIRPEVVRAGDDAEVHLRVVNRSSGTTAPLQLWEPVGDIGGAAMRLAPLRRGEEAAASYHIPADRRGVLIVGPLRVTRRDLLGLVQDTFDAAPPADVTVVPRYQLLAPPAGSGGGGTLSEIVRVRSLAAASGEFRGLRDYVPGDDLRRVHWKASARSEDLKVRELDGTSIRRCLVVLDRAADQYDTDSFERAVSITASVTISAAAAMPTRLFAGRDLDVRGPNLAMAALAGLARVTPGEGHDVEALSHPAHDGLGLVVLVTGTTASPAHAALRARSNPSEISVVVACTAAPTRRERLAVDGTGWESFLESWHAVAGRQAALTGRERAGTALGEHHLVAGSR